MKKYNVKIPNQKQHNITMKENEISPHPISSMLSDAVLVLSVVLFRTAIGCNRNGILKRCCHFLNHVAT